jgi:muramoyltetrapeptide carboxypeptidase LdcA involved in peptidoglycan recycling
MPSLQPRITKLQEKKLAEDRIKTLKVIGDQIQYKLDKNVYEKDQLLEQHDRQRLEMVKTMTEKLRKTINDLENQ